jgi:hypothetical protein
MLARIARGLGRSGDNLRLLSLRDPAWSAAQSRGRLVEDARAAREQHALQDLELLDECPALGAIALLERRREPLLGGLRPAPALEALALDLVARLEVGKRGQRALWTAGTISSTCA